MQITISAPGKIHLLGEHSVVYGYPALLSSLNIRIKVTLTTLADDKNGSPKLVIRSRENTEFIKKSIEIFQKSAGLTHLPGLSVYIESDIPIRTGLGSSAALSVALMGGLFKLVKNLWNPVKINELAYEVEKIQHAHPSGGDNTVATFGGLVWYRKETEFLKSIWNLPVSSYYLPSILLIDSGRSKETTGEMVSYVREKYTRQKSFYESLFKDQEEQTRSLLIALRKKDKEGINKSVFKGEQNLEKMGIVGKKAQVIIREIEEAGGVAKISGAGGIKEGSGIILCIHPENEKLKKIAARFTCPTYEVRLGDEGIRIEKKEGII